MANFFDGLIKKGRIVDEGIKRLDKWWGMPHIFISKYGDRVDEASKYLENLESIKHIHNELSEDSQPRLDYVTDVDRFLDECQKIYEDMKQKADDTQALLTEFGYEGLSKLNEVNVENEESSILDPELMENLAITDPYEHLRIKENNESDEENISPERIETEVLPKFIATPVIKSVGSVPNGEIINKHLRIGTPLRGVPQEPIYSPYYYNN